LEVAWGDIRDRNAVFRALRDAEVVYHLAGYAKAWARQASKFHAINAEGTANVCDAAKRNGVGRIVHISTALLAPPEEPDLTVDYERTTYQRSKAQAERIVFDYVDAGGSAVIVRASRTYGPGPLNQANSITRLIDLYSRGLFRFRIHDRNARANYVHVRDVVAGLIAAAERGADGAAYVLGGENRTMPQVLDDITSVTGRQYKVFTVPQGIAKTVAVGCELCAHVGFEPLITPDWVDLLCVDWPVSSNGARSELGYRPRPWVEGVKDTLAWLEAGRPSLVGMGAGARP
jgi:farnesol dehydrogenase